MPKRIQNYRPLFPSSWFGLGRTRAWRADDHLLIVETRSLREHYTRFYWADIQSILLYGLNGSTSVLTALEVVCVLAAMAPFLALWKLPWAFVPAVLFVGFYAFWRLARPHRACQVATRTNNKRFAIPGTLVACRRVVDELRQSAQTAQNMLSEQTMANNAVVTSSSTLRQRSFLPLRQGSLRKEPILAIHVIAFVLGLLGSLNIALFVLYCVFLTLAYFFEQDFEFPLTVRSAAVMSQMLAGMQLAFWILARTRLSYEMKVPFEHWQFGLPRILISLYGIAAVYWVAMQRTRPQRKVSTVLGLS